MRTSFIIITVAALLLVFAACNNQNELAEKDTRLYQLLQGDWKSRDFKRGFEETFCFTFSAQDSLCSVFHPTPPVSRMKVIDGKLHVWEQSFWQKDEPVVHREFGIVAVTQNYLRLVALDADSKEMIASAYRDTLHSDTIVLKRLTEKNSVRPEIISFYSSGCFGTCPSLAIDVDASQKVRCFGQSYAPVEGGQRGTISDKAYNDLLHVLRLIPLNTLKKEYRAGYTDAQTVCIAIRTNGEWQTCYVYGNDKEPMELRMLFYRLFQLSRDTRWSPAPAVTIGSFKAYHVQAREMLEEMVQFVPPVVVEE